MFKLTNSSFYISVASRHSFPGGYFKLLFFSRSFYFECFLASALFFSSFFCFLQILFILILRGRKENTKNLQNFERQITMMFCRTVNHFKNVQKYRQHPKRGQGSRIPKNEKKELGYFSDRLLTLEFCPFNGRFGSTWLV